MAKRSDKYMNREALPDTLKVEDISSFLAIGRGQGYELVNKNEFHVVRIGRTIRISKKCFLKWFDG
ncbi:helix-turn-helix domain-containing protein [Paenibacillus sp. Marseille-Q4541]|uniref:helix-turn-helix domain-containing protein n=1 Tax=Paenibacillus sp. Marseille-Q4541 TaxID=2831522 RepID=UPI0020189EB3|nr:helix-turn-helix domain-containing protein [Paenibacillus sp. Marseille-Q4541]